MLLCDFLSLLVATGPFSVHATTWRYFCGLKMLTDHDTSLCGHTYSITQPFPHLEERDINEVWWTKEKCPGTERKASSLMASVHSAGSCWAGSWRRKVIGLSQFRSGILKYKIFRRDGPTNAIVAQL